MFSQRRAPAADATSTLLNFLKQEQAMIAGGLPATQDKQQQLTPGHADSSNLTGQQAAAPQATAGKLSSPSAAITAPAVKSKWGTPSWQPQRQQQGSGVAGAGVQQQQQGAAARSLPAATVAATRLDSWNLDGDSLPDDSPSTHAGGPAAGTTAAAVNSSPAATASSHVSAYTPSSSNRSGSRSRPLSADTTAGTGTAAPAAGAAEQPAYAGHVGANISSSPNQQQLGAASFSPAPGRKDDADRQQVVLQMAAALERRAQLQQQQQFPDGSSSISSSPSRNMPGKQQDPTASYSASPAALAATVQPAAGSVTSDGFGLSTPVGSPNKLSPLAAPSGPYSSRSSSMSKTHSTAAAATAAADVTPSHQAQGSFAGSGAVMSGTPAGLGGLLARGLADLGISESKLADDTAVGSGPTPRALTAVAATTSSSSSVKFDAGGAGPPAGVSLLRGVSALPTDGGSAQQHGVALALPPGVSPIAGRRSPGVLPAAAAAAAAPTEKAVVAPNQSPAEAAAVQVQQKLPVHAQTAFAASSGGTGAAHKGGTGSSVAAAAALLSSLTGSPATGRWTASSTAQQQQHQQQHLNEQQLQPQEQQQLQQQQQQAVVPGLSADLDSQLAAMRQLSQLQGELADHKLSLARLRQQSEEDHARHASEVSRLRGELQASHQQSAADISSIRQEAAEQVAAAEARARKEVELQHSVLSAQLSAQAAAIQQEREALMSQRVNTDMLANLSEQVRGAASITAEREARALAALEKSSAERAAALAAREKLLQEREDKVCSREVELEGLKSHLTRLLSGLDAHREAEQQVLAGHAARLSKETARLEALQAVLLSEREETKLAVVMEKQALEEARTARIKEREAFIVEVVAERRRLAEENAAAARAAEEARANLLDLKSRVAQYEAQAAAALRQAHEEQAKAEAAREAATKERATLDELKRDLQVATAKLDDDRQQLQDWGGRLSALRREFDDARQEVKSARTEIESQRTLLAQQGAVLSAAQDKLEAQRHDLLAARLDLDRQRVEIANARAALSKERIAASRAATDAAAAAVASITGYDAHSIDLRTAALPGLAAATAAKRGYGIHGLWSSASVPHSISSATAAAAAAARRCNSTLGGTSSKAGKKLRRLVDKLQGDQGKGRRVSSTVKSQQDFLALLRSSSPVSNTSGSTFEHKAGELAVLSPPAAVLPPDTAPCSTAHMVLYPGSSLNAKHQPHRSTPGALGASMAAAGHGQHTLSAVGPAPASAAQAPASEVGAAAVLLQQLVQLQQLMQQQQQQTQQLGVAGVRQQEPPLAAAAVKADKTSSSSTRSAGFPSKLVAGLDNRKLQQLAKQLQQKSQLQCHAGQGSCGISRVSSDLTQMLTLSVSVSSGDSNDAEDGISDAGIAC